MATVLVKEFLKGTLGIVNHETQEPIDALFANEAFVSADENIATVSLDPGDGPDTAVLDFKGIAKGETDLDIDVDATYVDPKSNEQVTKHKKVRVHMTVEAGETETDLVVNFGPAQPIPDQTSGSSSAPGEQAAG